jgi:phospholipid-translocating ATPase
LRGGFIYHHGRDLAWWLILILSLAAVIVFELAVQSLRKVYYPDDVDLFQVWQKDPFIRARFKEVLRQEEEGMNLKEEDKDEEVTEVTGTAKEMLDARPERLKRKEEKALQKEKDASLGIKKEHRFGVGGLTRKKNELDDDIEMKDVERRGS